MCYTLLGLINALSYIRLLYRAVCLNQMLSVWVCAISVANKRRFMQTGG